VLGSALLLRGLRRRAAAGPGAWSLEPRLSPKVRHLHHLGDRAWEALHPGDSRFALDRPALGIGGRKLAGGVVARTAPEWFNLNPLFAANPGQPKGDCCTGSTAAHLALATPFCHGICRPPNRKASSIGIPVSHRRIPLAPTTTCCAPPVTAAYAPRWQEVPAFAEAVNAAPGATPCSSPVSRRTRPSCGVVGTDGVTLQTSGAVPPSTALRAAVPLPSGPISTAAACSQGGVSQGLAAPLSVNQSGSWPNPGQRAPSSCAASRPTPPDRRGNRTDPPLTRPKDRANVAMNEPGGATPAAPFQRKR